jgi:hypothetical protein
VENPQPAGEHVMRDMSRAGCASAGEDLEQKARPEAAKTGY